MPDMTRREAAGITLTYFKKYNSTVRTHMAPDVQKAFEIACGILKEVADKEDVKNKGMTIHLTEKETDKARAFQNKHLESCNTSKNPFHSNVRFHFIVEGFGIGDVVDIKCMKCKEKECLTDIESW